MNQQTLITIGTYLYQHWPEIVTYSVNGLSIAIVLQWLKRKYKLDQIPQFRFLKVIHLDGPRIVAMLFSAFAALSTAASWLADPTNAQYIPIHYAFIVTAGVALHRFLVSPASRRIEASLEPYLEAVAQLKQEQAAAVPQTKQAPITAPVIDTAGIEAAAAAALPTASLPPSLSPFEGNQPQG